MQTTFLFLHGGDSENQRTRIQLTTAVEKFLKRDYGEGGGVMIPSLKELVRLVEHSERVAEKFGEIPVAAERGRLTPLLMRRSQMLHVFGVWN